MKTAKLTKRFCKIVNQGLRNGTDTLHEAKHQLENTDQIEWIEKLEQAYNDASAPTAFYVERVEHPDHRLDQAYELLCEILDESTVDPKANFVERLNSDSTPLTFIMLLRTWQTLGACKYDKSGNLTGFDYDALQLVSNAASVIAGDYISLETVNRPQTSIAGIGQLATRIAMQRGKGHGTALVREFELTCLQIAQKRGEQIELLLTESEPEAALFWQKMGFKHPLDSRYFQPPIAYDPITGDRLFDEVPEILMVKLVNSSDQSYIDSRLLCDAVHALYLDWYAPGDLPEPAMTKASKFIFDELLVGFEESIAHHGEKIPLVEIPKLNES